MSYTRHTWTHNETITAAKLNNIEDGIEEGGGGAGVEVIFTATMEEGGVSVSVNGNFASVWAAHTETSAQTGLDILTSGITCEAFLSYGDSISKGMVVTEAVENGSLGFTVATLEPGAAPYYYGILWSASGATFVEIE